MAELSDDACARLVASMSPEARAAWYAVLPMIGDDSSAFIRALAEAACATAVIAGCDQDSFVRGNRLVWGEVADDVDATRNAILPRARCSVCNTRGAVDMRIYWATDAHPMTSGLVTDQ